MTPQTSIAHYRVISKLGEGGMGAVYRATDTKLGRDVALKVLPDAFAEDADRLARFRREAEVLASLNHPNIAAIYGLEDRTLVLELVEGLTLAERIAQGAMPLEEALGIAGQIAEALEYAHDKGVIHRDLNPANIKLAPDGRVKVLDFGLAKALGGDTAIAADPKSSPTLTMRATMAGAIMGTAAYMAPEQARGQEVDKRADIWSFGVVLYEMLTGRMLFDAPTISDSLALVLTKSTDLQAVPAQVRRLMGRCLERDRRKRLRDIGDAMSLVEEPAIHVHAAPRRSQTAIWVAGIAAAGAICAAALLVAFREKPAQAPIPVRFDVPMPENAVFGDALSVSPDGRYLAFVANKPGGLRQVWIRALDSLEARALPGTEYAGSTLVWSPDSRSLLYSALGQVKSVDVYGGAPQTVCSGCTDMAMGSWSRNGTILLTSNNGVMRIAPGGGTPTALTSKGLIGSIVFVGDERHVLFSRRNPADGVTAIYAGELDSERGAALREESTRRLANCDGTRFDYAPSPDERQGQILFTRGGALMAQPINARKLEVSGPAVPVAEAAALFAASGNGVLAYRKGSMGGGNSQLIWYDRHGRQAGQVGPPASYRSVQLLPDGKSVLTERMESGASHIWMGDLSRGVFSRLIAGDSNEVAAVPVPDGRIIFSFSPPGAFGDLYIAPAGGGTPEPLVKSASLKHGHHVSRDGKFLIYDEHNGAQRQDLWVLPLGPPGTPPKQPVPFLATGADETFGQFSPNGKWVAYSSDETGRREVYVREFAPEHSPAAGSGKWLISTAGGDKPRWSHDGRELFYIGLDGHMTRVEVKAGSSFEPGIPEPLFDVRTAGFESYDIAADGRFLVDTPLSPTSETSTITVVLNWQATLPK
jgi:Tol biopolymer transport system component